MTMDGGGGQGDGPPCWHPRRPRRSIGGGGGAQGGASGVAPAGAVASSTRFFPWRLAVVAVCAAQWPRRSIRVAAWLLAAATLDGARTARRRPSGARPAGRWQERERHGWRPRGVCRAALGLGTGAARVRWPHPPPPPATLSSPCTDAADVAVPTGHGGGYVTAVRAIAAAACHGSSLRCEAATSPPRHRCCACYRAVGGHAYPACTGRRCCRKPRWGGTAAARARGRAAPAHGVSGIEGVLFFCLERDQSNVDDSPAARQETPTLH